MSPLFVDTSYLLALELINDQNHEAAVNHWHRLTASPRPLVTTSYVFDEVVTLAFDKHFIQAGFRTEPDAAGGGVKLH